MAVGSPQRPFLYPKEFAMKRTITLTLLALALPSLLVLRWAVTDVEAARAQAKAEIEASMASDPYQTEKAAWEARR